MKKLLLLIIIGVLITVSCSNDSDTDLYTEIAKNEEAMRGAVNNKARGTYELVWLMDKHAVDNAVFSSELDPYYYVITHFPMNYFIDLIYINDKTCHLQVTLPIMPICRTRHGRPVRILNMTVENMLAKYGLIQRIWRETRLL